MPIAAMSCYIAIMRNRLRLFFLCLLIVSLPMQSIAGVARFECGMSHHLPEQSSVQADEAPMPEMTHGAAHEESHGHDAVAMQDASQADEDCDNGHQRAGCGTCAGCCIGASAPPPVVTASAVEEAVSGVQQFSHSSFTGHIPARIERPPRAA